VASAYNELRPGYPEDAVRWALAPALSGGAGVSGLRVVDLGAGTGILTDQLIRLGADVTAVEPDESMRAEFRRRLPSARLLAGSAEDVPVPDGSADAVLCGQAMHWFTMDRALPEIARVLTPGGVLAGLWNNDDDRVEWVAGLQAAAGGAASPTLLERRAQTAAAEVERFEPRSFGAAERAEFPNSQRYTAESLIALLRTHSKFLVMPAAERDRVLAQVADYLRSRPETSAGEFSMPLVTLVLRTVREVGTPAGGRVLAVENDLEALSSRELHDRAVRRALHHGDARFLWELLRAIPAAEAMEGDVQESEADAVKVSNLVADAFGSGEGEIADELRPLYIDYLSKHEPHGG
jgi:SAM-dependent methyltransferase